MEDPPLVPITVNRQMTNILTACLRVEDDMLCPTHCISKPGITSKKIFANYSKRAGRPPPTIYDFALLVDQQSAHDVTKLPGHGGIEHLLARIDPSTDMQIEEEMEKRARQQIYANLLPQHLVEKYMPQGAPRPSYGMLGMRPVTANNTNPVGEGRMTRRSSVASHLGGSNKGGNSHTRQRPTRPQSCGSAAFRTTDRVQAGKTGRYPSVMEGIPPSKYNSKYAFMDRHIANVKLNPPAHTARAQRPSSATLPQRRDSFQEEAAEENPEGTFSRAGTSVRASFAVPPSEGGELTPRSSMVRSQGGPGGTSHSPRGSFAHLPAGASGRSSVTVLPGPGPSEGAHLPPKASFRVSSSGGEGNHAPVASSSTLEGDKKKERRVSQTTGEAKKDRRVSQSIEEGKRDRRQSQSAEEGKKDRRISQSADEARRERRMSQSIAKDRRVSEMSGGGKEEGEEGAKQTEEGGEAEKSGDGGGGGVMKQALTGAHRVHPRPMSAPSGTASFKSRPRDVNLSTATAAAHLANTYWNDGYDKAFRPATAGAVVMGRQLSREQREQTLRKSQTQELGPGVYNHPGSLGPATWTGRHVSSGHDPLDRVPSLGGRPESAGYRKSASSISGIRSLPMDLDPILMTSDPSRTTPLGVATLAAHLADHIASNRAATATNPRMPSSGKPPIPPPTREPLPLSLESVQRFNSTGLVQRVKGGAFSEVTREDDLRGARTMGDGRVVPPATAPVRDPNANYDAMYDVVLEAQSHRTRSPSWALPPNRFEKTMQAMETIHLD